MTFEIERSSFCDAARRGNYDHSSLEVTACPMIELAYAFDFEQTCLPPIIKEP
jgi:hypothetical protein